MLSELKHRVRQRLLGRVITEIQQERLRVFKKGGNIYMNLTPYDKGYVDGLQFAINVLASRY